MFEALIYHERRTIICTAFLAVLLLVLTAMFIPAPAQGAPDQPKANKQQYSAGSYGNANVVTNGFAAFFKSVGDSTSSASYRLQTGFHASGRAITNAGSVIATAGRDMGSFVGGLVAGSMQFVGRIPSNALGFVGRNLSLSAIIRPADKIPTTKIIVKPEEYYAATAVLAAQTTPQPTANTIDQTQNSPATQVQWPMHGYITTNFGVAHRPYQVTHTGIDISDGKGSGITPIKSFKSGRVSDVVHSRAGLGNHVSIDHGGGIVSVYAHMYSIAVAVGQEVNLETVLGLKGNSGVSTGPHLHLEIWVNGIAVDPRQHIPGNP